MKKYDSEKVIAYMALVSGLLISAVAIYYSVAGLLSIFAAAAVPIIIMGVALEGSKLVATVWLKMNWDRAPRSIKAYLISAIVILMIITSMGIFGFLSKAHLDQNLVSGDVVDRVAILDEKIKTQRDNIEAARKALSQMDSQVDQVLGRSDDSKGAERAVQIRRNQAKERERLQKEISTAQTQIAKLNEERAPIAKDLRAVEAEVGPIKYIAKLIYGDNPDANVLEKAVTWVIIIIVIVFDPLAVILLLASQYSFQWLKLKKDEESVDQEMISDLYEFENTKESPTVAVSENPHPVGWMYPKHADIQNYRVEDADEESESRFDERKPLDEWNEMIAEAEKAADEELRKQDEEEIENASGSEKQAMMRWKSENPNDSLKHQKKLLAKGFITELPWKAYLKAQPDEVVDEAAVEAAKWAAEQLESKKKDYNLDGEGREQNNQKIQGPVGYVQNEEQNQSTIWQRVKNSKRDE